MRSVLAEKPHAVIIPYPAQGHITPMLKLAKFLHLRGFHITYVNTEFNHRRLLNSQGSEFNKVLNDFRFETIPDGLPPSRSDATQDIPTLCYSIRKNFLAPFRDLLMKLNDSSDVPNVTCIVSDGHMSFTLQAAEELDIPEVVFFTTSACGLMCYFYFSELIKRGYVPLKDESYLTNGYLDTIIDWIPGMKGIRLRDLSSYVKTLDPDDILINFNMEQAKNSMKAKGLILNTFDDLEHEVLEDFRSKFDQVYTIGPLQLLDCQLHESELKSIGSNLWKEDMQCLEWLNKRDPNSVVYVNFGSITVMTLQQLSEFAWGLANSKVPFLWIIRPDLVPGESAILSEEFIEETRERGLLASWCPQEQVLSHHSVGGFLTHNGWNSTLESISEGVPMICWPFFAEQQMNCRYACTHWGIGMEINSDVKRDEIERLIRELMEGDKGWEKRKKAMEWKEKAQMSIKEGGTSYVNLERLVKDLLL